MREEYEINELSIFAVAIIATATLLGFILYPNEMSRLNPEMIYEGGSEEEEEKEEEKKNKPVVIEDTDERHEPERGEIRQTWRQRLLRLIGNDLPRLRNQYGNALIGIIDPEDYKNNVEKLSQITSHIEGLDTLLDMAVFYTRRRIENSIDNLIRHGYVFLPMYGAGRNYGKRTRVLRQNPFLQNYRYLRFRTMGRRMGERFAESANIPITRIDRAYRMIGGIMRAFRRK